MVVQINGTCSEGSTGKICMEISKLLTENGIENLIFHAQDNCKELDSEQYCSRKYIKYQALMAHIKGNYGLNSVVSTKRLISRLDEIKPEIVHLHNIHSHECNFEMLFEYLKKTGIKVLWTFHDCWAFTGYCTHFDYIKCEKWKTECYSCPQYKGKSLFKDRSSYLFEKKKKAQENLDLTIITPSKWLSELVGESFLKNYPRYVINNGIDTDLFYERESNFREENGIKGKMILGVAYKWNERKGIDVFVELKKRLGSGYTIVLVGTDEKTEKNLPKGFICIRQTHSKEELSEIYSAADVFFNPTREDTYPTVNMEAIACLTPVVTFKTGGSAEMLDDTCGISVERDNIEEAERAIRRICESKLFDKEDLKRKAAGFDAKKCFSEYLAVYKRLLSE